MLRSADVGLVFTKDSRGYTFTAYRDGDGNGIRSADIQSGVDVPISAPARLADDFRGVDFGLLAGVPALDAGGSPPTGDPIKFGSSKILTFGPLGSSSSGSVYILGHGAHQLVLRVYGATGKVRTLELNRSSGTWTPR